VLSIEEKKKKKAKINKTRKQEGTAMANKNK
jgi:hypothetical protein